MLSHLKGKIIDRNFSNNILIIEVNNIGFSVAATTRTLAELKVNDERIVYVHLSSNDLGIRLCGFLTKAEKELFELLISVSGVGPKAALKIIGQFKVEEFIPAVIREDVNLISKAQGVGKKTAERIILELKTKFKKINVIKESDVQVSDKRNEAAEILSGLGFDALDIERKLNAATQENIGDDVELLVRYCLSTK